LAQLNRRTGIDALHLISHGSQGVLYLGSSVLSSDNFSSYMAQYAGIGNTLSPTGDILLYGCNVAQGDTGLAFIQQVAAATAADVAASTDLTGGAGNWILEQSTGSVETIAIRQDDYTSTLSTTTDSPFLIAAVNLATRAYSDAHFHGDAVKIAAINAPLQAWSAINPSALGATPDIGSSVADGHLFRYEYGNASATVGWTILDGKKTLGIAFEGTNFDTQPLDLWDDIVDISGHANKLSGLMAAVAAYANAPSNGIEQVLVAGHSLGGSVAQEFMERYGSDTRYRGATFGNPGTLDATTIDASRFVNFSHTGDVVPYVGEYGVKVANTGLTLFEIAGDIKTAFEIAALATPAGVAAYAIDAVVDALRDKVLTQVAYSALGTYFGLSAAAVETGLTFAINRNDYQVIGTRVRFDLEHINDAIVGITEHSVFDATNEVNYTASLKTYLDYVGSNGSYQSGFYLMGTSAADALQAGEVNAYTITFGGYTAILGANGADTIGEHTLQSNDNEPSVMVGGLGNDTYYFDNLADQVIEKANEGTDTVKAYVNVAGLAANVENLTLISNSGFAWFNANIDGTGNNLTNAITGNGGNNRLSGLDGNDTLDGGFGSDTLDGGSGNDTLIAHDGNDQLMGRQRCWCPADVLRVRYLWCHG
jgi:pimeloyl-ACP methyl ester carboxylesterase